MKLVKTLNYKKKHSGIIPYEYDREPSVPFFDPQQHSAMGGGAHALKRVPRIKFPKRHPSSSSSSSGNYASSNSFPSPILFSFQTPFVLLPFNIPSPILIALIPIAILLGRGEYPYGITI